MISQWVNSITDFSSQYGNDLSLSYIVGNLVGPPKVYPKYGDYADTTVFRTYGHWWDNCPSKKINFSRDYNVNIAQDYIEFEILNEVYATNVDVYETYNPGAVVALYAAHITNDGLLKWKLLYEKDCITTSSCLKSRINSINFTATTFPVKLFRLIFDSSQLDYYTELDAISVTGHTFHSSDIQTDKVLSSNNENIIIEVEGSSVDPLDYHSKKLTDSEKNNSFNDQNYHYCISLTTDDIQHFDSTDYDVKFFTNLELSNSKSMEHSIKNLSYLNFEQKSDFCNDSNLSNNILNKNIDSFQNLNSISSYNGIPGLTFNNDIIFKNDVEDVTNICYDIKLCADRNNRTLQNHKNNLNKPAENESRNLKDIKYFYEREGIKSDIDCKTTDALNNLCTNNLYSNIIPSNKINENYDVEINKFENQFNSYDVGHSTCQLNNMDNQNLSNNDLLGFSTNQSCKNENIICHSLMHFDCKIYDKILDSDFYTEDKIQENNLSLFQNCNCTFNIICTNCEYISRTNLSKNIFNLSNENSSQLMNIVNKGHRLSGLVKLVHNNKTDSGAKLNDKVNKNSKDNFCEYSIESVPYFSILPIELIQRILLHLDLTSLFRLATTCKYFNQLALHPYQFCKLDLRQFWHKLTNDVLQNLSQYCYKTKYLNLSWCTQLQETSLCNFMDSCSSDMNIVRLDNCNINSCLSTIATNFINLNELSLRSCIHITGDKFDALTKLKNLTYLDVYRTRISTQSALLIVRSCVKLKHLNFGSCPNIKDMDSIVAEFHYIRNLITVDLWRARSLTSAGILSLSNNCAKLREIDLGWCDVPTVVNLVVKCRFLEKIFLTANRSINDLDLEAISRYCNNLQQLDILGTREVTVGAVLKVLIGCPKLQLLDLSFCLGIESSFIQSWKLDFQHVNIKNSTQMNNTLDLDETDYDK